MKTMYARIFDAGGQLLVHRNVKSTPDAFLEVVAPYREDLVVAAEPNEFSGRANMTSLSGRPPSMNKRPT